MKLAAFYRQKQIIRLTFFAGDELAVSVVQNPLRCKRRTFPTRNCIEGVKSQSDSTDKKYKGAEQMVAAEGTALIAETGEQHRW